jgi:uncharacterized membrane protein
MLRRVSLLGLWLEPLGSIIWILFLVWTVLVATLWTTGFGEPQLDAWIPNLGLRSALVFLCKIADAIWIALAAASAYLCVADSHGLPTARRWAIILFAGAAAVIACSVWTHWPLGPVLFTRRLGAKLGPVPVVAPFLWFVLILGGRTLWMRLFRRAGHTQIAFGAGLAALLTELNLETLASRMRGWWFWYSPATHEPVAAPFQNYVTWFVGATVLAILVRESKVVSGDTPGHSDKLIAILVLINLVGLATHLAGLLHL